MGGGAEPHRRVLTMGTAKLLKCEQGWNGPAAYVAPCSPPASMAVRKVKFPCRGRGVEPWATAAMGWVRGERPPPSVKTGKARWWGSSLHLPPPSPPRQPPLPPQQQQCLPESAPLWAPLALASLLECPAPGVWVGQRLGDDPGLEGPWRDGAPGSASFSIFKNQPPLAIQRRTLSPVSGCKSHVQHVCQLSQQAPTIPHEQPDPGRQSLCCLDAARPCGLASPHTALFPWWLGSFRGTQSCSESAFARAGTAGP